MAVYNISGFQVLENVIRGQVVEVWADWMFIKPAFKYICRKDVFRDLLVDRFRNVGGMDAAVEPTGKYSRATCNGVS